jgi:regulator of protease activity HflC (stomatin/prohibitin superfamily)
MLALFILILLLLVVGFIVFTQYWMPRTAAFRDSRSRVRIWFGQGEIVLWNPGQTFAFLRNKQLAEVGSEHGGFRTVFAMKNEEAIGPISLQTALFTWNDDNVLTRDGQPLRMSIGVWWKVADVPKYVFKIYNESQQVQTISQPYVAKNYAVGPGQVATTLPQSGSARFDSTTLHDVADRWLRVLTESSVRSRVNRLAVSDVVSAQAMEFLQASGTDQSTLAESRSLFESVLAEVRQEIQSKASDFGLSVDQLEVQHVYLPQIIQDAINETRIAFLAPIKGERESEAVRISLEKLVSVLGRDNVALNQIMSNLKGANFITPMPMMQPIFDKFNATQSSSPALPAGEELK